MTNYKDSNGNDLAQVVMCIKEGEVFTLAFSENESNACKHKINYFRDKGYAIYIYYVKPDVTEKWN